MTEGPLFIGNPVYHYEQLDSTNSSAMELLSKSKPSEGTAIMASFQTKGKGQYGRKWDSSRGKNILCSIILYPNFLQAQNQFYLNAFSSLAVRKLIAGLVNREVCIKWPNDIYVENRKVAGILIQNVLQQTQIKQSILGIGININQEYFDENLLNPSSVFLETNTINDLTEVRNDLFKLIEEYYLLLKTGRLDTISHEYNHQLYLRDIPNSFSLKNERITGTIKNISEEGKLVIEHDNKLESYDLNEVKYL